MQRQPGAETKTQVNDGIITFRDDYGVPGGTVIGILLPKNYIPDVIKFKDKPIIPIGLVGQVTTTPPGHIQILYSNIERRCAIVFNIHEYIVFGFKCIAKIVSDEQFPESDTMEIDESFDISLSRDFLNVNTITNEDLTLMNQVNIPINLTPSR